jgi:hypothetical protein
MDDQRTCLFSLPTELLDRIYGYLDWDRSAALIPVRPDIFAIRSVAFVAVHAEQQLVNVLTAVQ